MKDDNISKDDILLAYRKMAYRSVGARCPYKDCRCVSPNDNTIQYNTIQYNTIHNSHFTVDITLHTLIQITIIDSFFTCMEKKKNKAKYIEILRNV